LVSEIGFRLFSFKVRSSPLPYHRPSELRSWIE